MTIIEFYDSTAIHNALSTLLLCPDRLIFFGTDAKDRKLITKIQV